MAKFLISNAIISMLNCLSDNYLSLLLFQKSYIYIYIQSADKL